MSDNIPYPALVDRRLTPVYDQFVKLVLREKHFKGNLVASVPLAPNDRVLDLGAGTGTLTIMLKQRHPNVQVMGIDADAEILAIAREKSVSAGIDVTFELGKATALPYAPASFAHVFSTLVFSLLSHADKQQTLREVYRVLHNGGEFHLVDFGPPRTLGERWIARLTRRWERMADNLAGALPALFQTAGFADVTEGARFATLLGPLVTVHGRKAR